MATSVQPPTMTDHEAHPVRVTAKWAADGVYNNRLLKVGQVLHLPAQEAAHRARAGEVEFLCTVRALKDSVTVGNNCDLVLMKGQTGPCHPDRALNLREQGCVEILPTGWTPPEPAPEPEPTPVIDPAAAADLDASIRRKRSAAYSKE